MATAAPLPEGDWAALLERIKGGDDAESLEPLAHQLYAAVSAAGRRRRRRRSQAARRRRNPACPWECARSGASHSSFVMLWQP